MAAERKTISSHNSPIKYNNNGYVPRSRGYSDYDPIRI